MSMEDKKTIHCQLSTEGLMYMAYMPFVVDGGLFVRTTENYNLGETVQLHVSLLTEPDPYITDGSVVWITPVGALGGKPAGIGVQFTGPGASSLKKKFDTILTGKLKSSQLTDTM